MNEQRKKELWKEEIKAAPKYHWIQSRRFD